MPTTNPRLSVTLSHEDLRVLDRFSQAAGIARASLIADLVHSVVPQLDEAAQLIEMANAAPRKIKQGLVDDLSNATADAMGFLQPFNADYRSIMNSLQRELALDAEGKGARRRRASSGSAVPQNPRPLTGGSNS